MRDQLIDKIHQTCIENPQFILITADLGFGIFDNFRSNCGDQFLNVGICEQNMVGVASGMAIDGWTPILYSIGNFPTMRCLEQIRNLLCYHECKSIIVSTGAGFSYGQLGATHHATEDIGIMRSMPNVQVYSPANAYECIQCFNMARDTEYISYIRLDKSSADAHKPLKVCSIKHAQQYREGQDVLILCHGGILENAITASNLLSKDFGLEVSVATMPIISGLDEQFLEQACNKYEHLFVLEEHCSTGGLYSAVSEFYARKKQKIVLHPLGLKRKFNDRVGDQQYLRKISEIDVKSIVIKIKETTQKY